MRKRIPQLIAILVAFSVAASVAFAAASYPTSIKSFATRLAGETIQPAHMNDVQDEITAIETALLSGFAHVLRPDASANNRDIGLTTARWRDLLLGRTIDIAQGTITTDLKALDLTATWNAGAVVFTVLKANVTDTASAALSRFLDLQLGGVSQFFIYKDGSINSLAFAGIGTGADGAVARLLLDNGTITTNIKVLDAKTTWNAGGVTFTGILLNVTDTASAAASLLADLQVGGVSKFKVQKDGLVTTGGAVVLPADPTTALQAATKQYVDNAAQAKAATGSGAGNYSTTSATYVDVDATNLAPSLTAPTGYTILVVAAMRVDSPADGSFIALVDSAGAVRDEAVVGGSLNENISLLAQVAGNGASQTFKLRFRSVTSTQTTTIQNSSGTLRPIIHLIYAKTG